MADKIRWGLLSTARINDALIEPIRQCARSELVAVASRSADKARDYAREKKIPRAHDSYEALLEDPDIDAVYISLPNGLHCEWSVKAAEAGKHILCEKPIAITMEEFDQMEEAANRNGVVLFEAFMYLHHPQTLKVQEMIRDGQLGDLQTITSWFHFYLPPENTANVRLKTDLGGGSLWDVGVYPNSMAIVMFGQAPTDITASQIVGESGVDVAMRAQLHFPDQGVAQISSGFRSPFRRGTHIVGDKGIVDLPEPWKPGMAGQDSRILYTGRDGREEIIQIAAKDPYVCEVQAMEACVLDGTSPVIPLSLSRTFLRSVLAIHESARTGKTVAL